MSAGAAVVEFRGVEKSFGGVPVLRGVELGISDGESYSLVGGSGSGKSVCLKHIVGLLRPDRGRVTVFGQDVSSLPEAELVPVRRRLGMVFQGAALFDSLSVYENVAYPLREHRDWPEPRVAARVEECLDAVGLPGIGLQMPSELSGGMRKRVGVARAIALEPELILYDEPTMGLDPANSRRIGQLIRALQERMRVTSLIVTHDMELCFSVSDRVGLLQGGRISVEGTVGEIRSVEHPELREFLEGSAEPVLPASARAAAPGAERGGR
jgi:phospholipid/cholesterol/gamma-HCH transport system ATP-binding protein